MLDVKYRNSQTIHLSIILVTTRSSSVTVHTTFVLIVYKYYFILVVLFAKNYYFSSHISYLKADMLVTSFFFPDYLICVLLLSLFCYVALKVLLWRAVQNLTELADWTSLPDMLLHNHFQVMLSIVSIFWFFHLAFDYILISSANC